MRSPDHVHEVVELLLELSTDGRLQPGDAGWGWLLLGSRLLALGFRLLA